MQGVKVQLAISRALMKCFYNVKQIVEVCKHSTMIRDHNRFLAELQQGSQNMRMACSYGFRGTC
ncbi:MAG: hypothetical protein QXS06_01035 [Desulfurococcaceae archaeon]